MIKIITDGQSYSNGIPLAAAVLVLENYGKVYAAALTESCVFLNIPMPDTPSIKLESVKNGSGHYDLIFHATAVVVPMLPQVYQTAWECFKNAHALIQALNASRKNEGPPVSIHVQDSPGAIVLVSGRDSITVPRPVFNVAKTALRPFAEIAKAIRADRNAHASTYYSQDYDGQKRITNENAEDFISEEFTMIDDAEVEIEANIYKMNKKTLNGSLEFHDGDEARTVPFVVDKEMSVLAAIALSSERCNITAKPERRANILGESRIVRFHVSGISIPKA